jgi:hypothetical protein
MDIHHDFSDVGSCFPSSSGTYLKAKINLLKNEIRTFKTIGKLYEMHPVQDSEDANIQQAE